MKYIMRKAFLFFCLIGLGAQAQVSTEPAEADEIDPDGSLKIIVNLTQLDATKDYVQNLQDAAADGEDLYIWTWSPAEHPAGHPLVNGTGERPWQNSNDTLRMTKEAENIYSYTLIPTQFYEVDAQTVYENDIHFLVKPKNGGGYGDPDRKSDDLSVAVDPPSLERNAAYFFPGRFQQDDLVVFYYDNKLEEKASMQNMNEGEVYFYAQATLSDSSVVRIANNPFSVGNFPELAMDFYGDGIFKKYFVPRRFFNIPANQNIIKLTFFLQKKVFFSGDDRIDYDVLAELGCD